MFRLAALDAAAQFEARHCGAVFVLQDAEFVAVASKAKSHVREGPAVAPVGAHLAFAIGVNFERQDKRLDVWGLLVQVKLGIGHAVGAEALDQPIDVGLGPLVALLFGLPGEPLRRGREDEFARKRVRGPLFEFGEPHALDQRLVILGPFGIAVQRDVGLGRCGVHMLASAGRGARNVAVALAQAAPSLDLLGAANGKGVRCGHRGLFC
ncbi:hypothetical protein RirG_010750 [Rhizophagus irregularis DAOM 197198w]|uniref:Uncharacterized protein n=1 Tax=Rhizophagus irregularis (strain DAOM 197198w) TaxID=1432141 RepID=A0A015KAU1_RHIIW|nr:hypothetical protein RirG_010750 [Rhizophagus irregularis DAOM 197198w]